MKIQFIQVISFVKKLFFSLLISLAICINCTAQVTQNTPKSEPEGIYIEKFNTWIYPAKYPDTIVKQLNDTVSLKFLVTTKKGAGIFYAFDQKNRIMIKGGYSDALDTFKRYVTHFNQFGEGRLGIGYYYQPVPDGEWIYYDHKGEILKKETYVKGNIP